MNYTNALLFGLGVLGLLIHVLIKMDGLNRKQNGDFKFGPFIKLERFSIMLTLAVIVVAIFVKTEITQLERVGKWLGLGFVAIGYMAQSIVIHFVGKADKYLNKSNENQS